MAARRNSMNPGNGTETCADLDLKKIGLWGRNSMNPGNGTETSAQALTPPIVLVGSQFYESR